jgi:hypothetical protein
MPGRRKGKGWGASPAPHRRDASLASLSSPWQESRVRSASYLLPLSLSLLGVAVGACSALTGLNSYAASDCSEGCGDPNHDASIGSDAPGPPDVHVPARPHPDGGEVVTGNESNGSVDAGATDAGLEADDHCVPGDEASCGPQACAGCQGPDGLCAIGSADNACGLRGVRCQDCASIGEVCAAGACTPPTGDSGHLEQRICQNVATCSATCGPDCRLDCSSADTCLGTCGSACLYTCIKATNCLPTVGDRSVVTCASSGACQVTCTGTCLVHCASVGQCHVSCPAGVTPTACDGGTGWACGQSC